MTPHPSHRWGFVEFERRCVVCFVEPDWPLAETRCSSLGRDGREEKPRKRSDNKPPATDKEILALLQAGASMSEISKTVRAEHRRIKRIADAYRVPIRPRGKREI